MTAQPRSHELFHLSQVAPASPFTTREARVVQVGLGPIGCGVVDVLAKRPGVRIIGAVDVNPDLVGKPLAAAAGVRNDDLAQVTVTSGPAEAGDVAGAVAIVSTSSDVNVVADQIEQWVSRGAHVISTCEELAYPWHDAPQVAKRLHALASEHGVTILGTGVNPGFAMDLLPTTLTGAASQVDRIDITRAQEAGNRRLPLQRKVGATLTVDEFFAGVEAGTVRHVGTTTSALAIADAMGWHLDDVTETISPLLADKPTPSGLGTIKPGNVRGVRQIVSATRNGKEVLRLELQMAVDVDDPRDEVQLTGDPDLNIRVAGGFPGDGATAAVVCNSIPGVLAARPGLHTMSSLAAPRAVS